MIEVISYGAVVQKILVKMDDFRFRVFVESASERFVSFAVEIWRYPLIVI